MAAIDTTALETAYMAVIDDVLTAGSINYELAKIALANFLAALVAYNGGVADNVSSWSMAGKTFSFRDMQSLRHPSFYQQELDSLIGQNTSNSGGYTVSIGNFNA